MIRVWEWLRAHPWAGWAGGAVALSVASFSAGRYMAPTKVIETTTTSVQTSGQATAQASMTIDRAPVKITRRKVITPSPAGPVVQLDTVVERGPVHVEAGSQASGSSSSAAVMTQEKVVEREAPRFMIGVTVGAGFNSGGLMAPSYGLIATGRVLGPLTLGIQGEANATQGSARLIGGLSF